MAQLDLLDPKEILAPLDPLVHLVKKVYPDRTVSQEMTENLAIVECKENLDQEGLLDPLVCLACLEHQDLQDHKEK